MALNCSLLHQRMSLCVKVCGLFPQLSVQFLRTEITAFSPFPSAMHCASFDFADSMPLCETGSHHVARATFEFMLLQPPEPRDGRNVPPDQASGSIFFLSWTNGWADKWEPLPQSPSASVLTKGSDIQIKEWVIYRRLCRWSPLSNELPCELRL